MSDADLVALARSGDADAFRVLVSRYRAMAMSVALHLSGDRQVAEDLVQEATLAAFVSLGRLRDPDRFRSWFYGTVLNVTRAWRRRQAGRLLTAEYPELTRATGRGERTHVMTELHITKVVTFPARVLAVLAGEPGQRVLPAWLSPLEGLPLAGPPRSSPPRAARYAPCAS